VAIKNIQTSHLVHDLKNPVNIIESGARALLEKQDRYGDLGSKQEKVVRRLLRNALKIKTLANSMLEVDMASHGVVKVEDCTLAGVFKHSLLEILDLVDPRAAEELDAASGLAEMRDVLQAHHIILEADEAHLNKVIQTDEMKLCLIVTNLLSNALKYKQKTVFLNCTTDGDNVQVSVRDDGPGIPKCHHNQIFDQYFQCVTVEGFPVRGHGLGLAGAQALTEALGGKLSLGDSQAGAEFIIRVQCNNEG
jgi:two-component system, OmpR family, sensor kinase